MSLAAMLPNALLMLLPAAGVATALAALPQGVMPRLRELSLLLLLPALFIAVRPGGLMPDSSTLRLLPGLVLLILLPLLRVRRLMPRGQGRAASGLGAGRVARLRHVWLPQLGPALVLGLLLGAAWTVASVLLF